MNPLILTSLLCLVCSPPAALGSAVTFSPGLGRVTGVVTSGEVLRMVGEVELEEEVSGTHGEASTHDTALQMSEEEERRMKRKGKGKRRNKHPNKHITALQPDSHHITALQPDSHHITALQPDSHHITALQPDSHHITALQPDSHHITALQPDSHHTTALQPDSHHITALQPDSHHTTALQPDSHHTTWLSSNSTGPHTAPHTALTSAGHTSIVTSDPCGSSHLTYCIHGTCKYMDDLKEAVCLCMKGFDGERCGIQLLGSKNMEEEAGRGEMLQTGLVIIAVVLSLISCIAILMMTCAHYRTQKNFLSAYLGSASEKDHLQTPPTDVMV